MSDWQSILITVVVPVLITAGLPYLSERLKAKREERASSREDRRSDAEVGQALRDQLWSLNGELTERVGVLEDENAQLRTQVGTMELRIVRLEDALRRHGHANEIELTRTRRSADG